MASVAAPVAIASGPDELDRLLDYDNAVEDFLRDVPVGNGTDHEQSANMPKEIRDEDQEIQVRKKRAPVPKLDEDRLLSTAGIPKLRKITRSRIKFHGKGHEFSDISHLLNTYQLWLDDLYPRAKFRDGLTMVEKVGHSKRMQVMRRAWLDETKPFRKEKSPDQATSQPSGNTHEDSEASVRRDEDLFDDMMREGEESKSGSRDYRDGPSHDELDPLPATDSNHTLGQTKEHQGRRRGPFDDDDSEIGDHPQEDELDALLAEQSAGGSPEPVQQGRAGSHADYGDDIDALMEGQEASTSNEGELVKSRTGAGQFSGHNHEVDFAAEEEVLADMPDTW